MEFNNKSKFIYFFNDENFLFEEADEKYPLYGQIIDIDGNEIGYLLGYLLDNNENFYNICDDISGDCETIASKICDNGSVNKKYLPKYKKI